MRFASVILDIPTQALDAPYTYAVPEAPAEAGGYDVEVGCAVLVPFGHRQAVGFVVGLQELPDGEAPAGIDAAKVKPVVRAVSPAYFDEEGAACAQWLSERYLAPLSSCVRLFTPPGGVPRMVRAQAGYWRLEEPAVGEVDDRWVLPGAAFDGFEPRKDAVKQASIVEALQAGELRVAELAAEFGAVSSTLKALEKQGVVRIERRRRMRGMPPGSLGVPEGPGTSGTSGFTPSPKPPLTAGQASALAAIDAARERGAGEVVLVDGVTGSGKTEVYLQAIEAALAAGRTACVLVPEISLTPQTVGRFRGRFGDTVAVMHSRMGAGERYDQWDFIRSGAARVVVGARSALFTPLANVGLIVIDEEHEGSYKQDSAPRYHARDVAVWMARRAGAAVVLGSATPSHRGAATRARRTRAGTTWSCPSAPTAVRCPPCRWWTWRASSAAGRAPCSRARSRARSPRSSAAGPQGGAPAEPARLREVPAVPRVRLRAGVPVVLHVAHVPRAGQLPHLPPLRLPRDGPSRVPRVRQPLPEKFGAGTQRVEADLRVLLDATPGVGPGVPIVRMDADTTGGKGAHQRLLEEFAAADAAVLLGTQMIAKGLDFEDVTLVGVINADTMLRLPDYRAAERTFALVEQVAGRAGRAELPGRVLVQTYEADAAPIRAAAAYDRALFLRDELPKRRMLRYPPYVRMANVLVWGKDEEAVRTSAAALYEGLAARVRDFGGEGWDVLPATPCVLAKLRGTYRWHLVVKCPLDGDLSGVLLPYFRARKPEREVNVAVDVDPDDLL